VLVSSQTGSGKTAAFMLPALQILSEPHPVAGNGPRVLVLTPTRELAMQVTKAAETYGKKLRRIRTVSIVGGMPYPVQNRLLKQGADILVATPGRLLDQMQSGRVDLSRLQVLVFDEADRMLDMGFKDDIDAVVAQVPENRQTLLFSATLDDTITRMAATMMKEPVRIDVSGHKTRHENIEQRLHYADDLSHKNRLLDHLLRDTEVEQAIVFTSTKRAADDLALDLIGQGHAAAALHGDMKQGARNRTLENLKRGRLRVLVATDVAARGIDVAGISHVINFDLPRQAEDYVHRIGRTGRAGRNGVAISLANVRESFQVRLIERFTTQQIPVSAIPGLEPTQKVFEKKPFGGKPGGKSRNGSFNGKPSGKSGGFSKASSKAFGKPFAGKAFGDKPFADKPFADKPFADKSYAGKPTGKGQDAPAWQTKPVGQGGAGRFDGRQRDQAAAPAAGSRKAAEARHAPASYERNERNERNERRDHSERLDRNVGGKTHTKFVSKQLPASTARADGWAKASQFSSKN
jgi:superfamily II DNA/RNA helicase